MKVRTLAEAARFVKEAGLAYVFPDGKMKLPSLWGAVKGDPWREWSEEDHGWTKAVATTWELKDELGAKRKALFGRYVRGKGTLIALDVAEALHSLLAHDDGLSPLARETYERLGRVGRMSTLRLRESLRLEGSKGNQRFSKTMVELYRRFLICNAGVDGSESRWPAAVIERVNLKAVPRAKAGEIVRMRLAACDPRVVKRLISSRD